jgi:5-methylcytosine-specific restriction endonuclease McrA
MKRDYGDPIYAEVRKRVLKRDKKKCQMPSCKSRFRLQVHHIQPWSKASSLRFDEFNLITLCKKCHDSIKDREHTYIGLFLRIAHENSKRH